MNTIIIIYSFLIGLVLASFLNALMYRLDKEYKYPEIFTKSSHCEKCKKQLKWNELIPVLSYLIYGGKCIKCGDRINLYYPISELFLGISFLLLTYYTQPWYIYIVVMILFTISYFDYQSQEIPQTPIHIFLILSAIYIIASSLLTTTLTLNSLPYSIALYISLLMFNFLRKIFKKQEAFGVGDALLLICLSVFLLPYQFLVLVSLSILIAGLVAILLIILKKLNMKSTIPFIPFITLAFTLTIVWGDVIYSWVVDNILFLI